MDKKWLILIVFGWCWNIFLPAQSFDIEYILEDIYNQLSEDDEILQEDLQEQLMGIAAHPINLNNTNAYSPLLNTIFDNTYYSNRLEELTAKGWTY